VLGILDEPSVARLEDPAERQRRADEIRFGSGPRRRRLLLFVGTLALFALVGGWGGLDLAVLVAVLAVHEAGHAVGMLAFGYRDVSVFFVPLFGAATSGHKPSVPAWQEAVVSLLGPLPGLFVGLAAWALAPLWPGAPEWLHRAVFLLLAVNFLNLLPFAPFDGGHFFSHVLFRRRGWLETAFAAFGGAGIGALALWLRDPVIGIVAFLAFAGIPTARGVRRTVEEAERSGWRDAASVDAVLGAEALVAERFAHVPEDRRLDLVRRVLSLLGSSPAGAGACALLLLLYATPFVLASVIAAASLLGGADDTLRVRAHEAAEQGDYPLAAELLRLAAAEAPEDGVHAELGWALNAIGEYEEARRAFSAEIDARPRHSNARLGRAAALDRLGRHAEAEKDLLAQIEMAPEDVRALEALGLRRLWQRRAEDAADYLHRAATLEPSTPGLWIALGRAHASAGRPASARAAIERLPGEGLDDALKVRAAAVHGAIGEPRRAAALVAGSVPALEARLAGLAPGAYGSADVEATRALAAAWALVGAEALARGELEEAERYLDASWRRGLVSSAAWQLGRLRTRQGRAAEAAALFEMAAVNDHAEWALPRNFRTLIRLEEWRRFGPGSPPRPAGDRVTGLRTARLSGRVLEPLAEAVIVLAGADGRVEDVRGLTEKNVRALERQLSRRGSARFDFPRPPGREVKTVHSGLLACAAATGCSIVLDLPLE
jgi:tetratricopeptide (TPR) repeat protein/Zn-dependent protease